MTILQQITAGITPHLDSVREQLHAARKEINERLDRIAALLETEEDEQIHRLERLIEGTSDANTLTTAQITVPNGWEWEVETLALETGAVAGTTFAISMNSRFVTAITSANQGFGVPTNSLTFKFRALPGDTITVRNFGAAVGVTTTVYLRGRMFKTDQTTEV